MKLIQSRQKDVTFIKCPDPVIIDKSKSWGPGNLQNGPGGAFLKMKNPSTVSHLVQPNDDFSAPIGWVYTGKENLYDKAPIYVGEKVLKGETKSLHTLDGFINYVADEDSFVVCNQVDEQPNLADSWLIKESQLKKDYFFE